MNQKIKIFFISTSILFLLILLVYVVNITSMPESIILFQSEELNLKTAPGISLKTKSTSESLAKKIQNYEAIEASTRNKRRYRSFYGKSRNDSKFIWNIGCKRYYG